ncbi:hypothetical protein [Tunturiibacter gelidiferens]|uniref:hypothetical protein n=1 Tax=Tunturiibacter gelidiferens TaxID=3069689 RepID=UPI003D9BDFDC
MPIPPFASWMLEQEARALLTRLGRVKPLALQESMLPAAGLLPQTATAIENFLTNGRQHLRLLVDSFLNWLRSPKASESSAELAQREFTMLRLRFNAVITHFDLFDNVITQRSESETGVWLSGLDVLSADALYLRGHFYEAKPIVCYLDRGVGASIRRARTRLPGGGLNPISIIRVPRERMVGSGIASSLIHEVGHQAAALLDLVESFRPLLHGRGLGNRVESLAWQLWERWISEIVADLWSVARVGVGSTMGLMGVVSLPRAFVFRLNPDDPHPTPWIRVKVSAALGKALYPQPMWDQLTDLWDSYYPVDRIHEDQRQVLLLLERTIPGLVAILLHHRPAALNGRSIVEALDTDELQPARLRALLQGWRTMPDQMYKARPTLVFAALGQGRADGNISPEEESTVVGKVLTHWAVRSTLQAAAGCEVKQSLPLHAETPSSAMDRLRGKGAHHG